MNPTSKDESSTKEVCTASKLLQHALIFKTKKQTDKKLFKDNHRKASASTCVTL